MENDELEDIGLIFTNNINYLSKYPEYYKDDYNLKRCSNFFDLFL